MARYDWSVVARQVVEVYETVTAGRPPVAEEPEGPVALPAQRWWSRALAP